MEVDVKAIWIARRLLGFIALRELLIYLELYVISHASGATAMWSKARKRILVLGGGFGGIYTVRALQKALHGRTDIEIALVNQENYFVFQPMLAEVISGNIGLLNTVTPIRDLCPGATLYVRKVEHIDL